MRRLGARRERINKSRPSAKKKIERVGKQPSLNPREWIGKFKDIPCFLLGNAPSLNNTNLSLLDDYLTIGINRIFFKYDPTILLWQDLALWSQEKEKVLQTKSIKYCREGSETQGGFYTFKLNGRDAKISNSTETLYGRGSSGSIAFQFAHALGCDPIILVGMDCRYEKNKNGKVNLTDFYGKNSMHGQHTLPACKKGLKFIKKSNCGRIIINCSDNKVFKDKKTIEEVISSLVDKKYNREELKRILLS